MKKNLLSLFSGCGGMDIGFEGGFKIVKSTLNTNIHKDWIKGEGEKYILLKDTIFETIFANDINPHAKVAWSDFFNKKRDNNLNDTYRIESIVDLVKKYNSGDSDIFPSDVKILTGGFPCQDFSVSGKRNGFDSHKDHNGNLIEDNLPSEETRGKLYMWMREVIKITLPNIFIAENVKGLSNLGQVKEIIQSDFSNINGDSYLVLAPRVLHAGNYGIPQSRERIFFIGFKKSALTPEALFQLSKESISEEYTPFPIATHRLNGELHYSSYEQEMTMFTKSKDVLQDLLEPEESDDLSQQYFSKAKYMGKHCQGQKEIDLERLSPTIRAEHHGNIEYRRLSIENGGKQTNEIHDNKKERRLTLRECSRIQTFPDDFNFVIKSKSKGKKFELSPSQGYKLVGNAVPPLLAYHIAKKIESNWSFYFDKN
jgi:DNA (cytosine-5)-methyltransferase 1